MNLDDTEFRDVRLGAVFFDPATGKQFQKVDEVDTRGNNVYKNEHNARSETGQKNFQSNDIVKAHKNHIIN